ncbi:MAG: HAMP domain-containing protein [Chloroflexaceae bacterium]|nr:HAMP domain-containing protein [Chloroflexaceae bacterium]
MNLLARCYHVLFARSMRQQLTMLLLLVGLIPLIVIALIATSTASNALEEQIEGRLADIAQTSIDAIDREIFHLVGDIQTFARSAQTIGMESNELSAYMNYLMQIHAPDYSLMFVADTSGQIVAVNTLLGGLPAPTLPLLEHSVADKEWFRIWFERPLPDGQSYLVDPYVEPLAQQADPNADKVLVFSHPIRDARGAIVGVWVTFPNWNTVESLVDSVLADARARGAEQMYLTLLTADQHVLLGGDGLQLDALMTHADTAKQPSMTGRGIPGLTTEYVDPSLVVGIAASDGHSTYLGRGWVALATQPRTEAFAPVSVLWSSVLFIGFIVSMSIVAVGLLSGRATTQPISALTIAASRAAAGDLDQHVLSHRNDEIGQLSHAFNHMVVQLHESHRNLEQRIAERTAELSQVNAQLTAEITERERVEAERAALQQQVINAQKEAIRELSTPLIPITDDAVIMPLIGTIDSNRAHQIMETLLEGVEKHHARTAILDITGVQVVDTQVANVLIQATKAVKLLGAQVVLTGIQPQIAQTIVHLGIDLRSLVTRNTLQDGMAYVFKRH